MPTEEEIEINRSNPKRGSEFEKLSKKIMDNRFRVDFEINGKIKIGRPAKEHKFDLVSNNFVGECKCYSWTKPGNIPSAKITLLNEAAFYLFNIPKKKNIKKFIVMKRDFHKKRKETLAEYYYRTNKHLLNDIDIFEIDERTKKVRKINHNI
jgi:hypothetical protein